MATQNLNTKELPKTHPTTVDGSSDSYQNITDTFNKVKSNAQQLLQRVKNEGVTSGGQTIIPPATQTSTIPATHLAEGANSVTPIDTNTTSSDQTTQAINGAGSNATTIQNAIQEATQKLNTPSKSQADLLAEQEKQWGIPETFKQIKDITTKTLPLQQQITDLDNQQAKELEANNARIVDQGTRDRTANLIKNKYNRLKAPIATQLNAYAAQVQALNGNLSTARQLANAAVSAATYDQEMKYRKLKDFISTNQTFLNSLKADQRFYFSKALTEQEQALAQARQDKSKVMDWMVKYPTAGISVDDTPEEAARKASQVSSSLGVAVIQDAATGKQIDIGTPEGLKQFISEHPEYNNWQKMNDYYAVNFPKMKATTKEALIRSAGIYPSNGEYTSSFWRDKVQGMIDQGATTADLNDFIANARRKFKDMSPKDLETGKRVFLSMVKNPPTKPHSAWWYFFHPFSKP